MREYSQMKKKLNSYLNSNIEIHKFTLSPVAVIDVIPFKF